MSNHSTKQGAILKLLLACVSTLAFASSPDTTQLQSGALPHGATTTLPQAPERALVMEYCTVCHTVERVQHSGGTDVLWEDRIRRMTRWGATIPEDKIAPVAAYLAKALPVRLRPPAELAFFANTAVSEAALHTIETTVRVAATFDAADNTLTVWLEASDAKFIAVGQRVRTFSLAARTTMLSAKVMRIVRQGDRCRVTMDMITLVHNPATIYIAEITINRGEFFSVPNSAIIEDGEKQLVYVQDRDGDYLQREVSTGLQGENYTQIIAGLGAGDQVVTLGGFFIDAEYKIKGTG